MRPSCQISFVNRLSVLNWKIKIVFFSELWDYKEITCRRLRSVSGSEYILHKCFLSLSCSLPVMIPSCCCMQWHWSLGPVSTPFSPHLCEDTVRRWPSAIQGRAELALLLYLPGSWNVRNKFLLFKSASQWYFIMAAWTDWYRSNLSEVKPGVMCISLDTNVGLSLTTLLHGYKKAALFPIRALSGLLLLESGF